MPKAIKQIQSIEDITPDPLNANLHTEVGRAMVENSIRDNGAGRSVLVDRNGTLIAGENTTEAFYAAVGDDVIVVQTDGNQLVVVQRTDLDITDDEDLRARKLALADNRASEVSLNWNADVLRQFEAQTPQVFENVFSPEALQKVFDRAGAKKIIEEAQSQHTDNDGSQDGEARGDKTPTSTLRFEKLRIPLDEQEAEDLRAEIDEWKSETGALTGFVANLITRVRAADI